MNSLSIPIYIIHAHTSVYIPVQTHTYLHVIFARKPAGLLHTVNIFVFVLFKIFLLCRAGVSFSICPFSKSPHFPE